MKKSFFSKESRKSRTSSYNDDDLLASGYKPLQDEKSKKEVVKPPILYETQNHSFKFSFDAVIRPKLDSDGPGIFDLICEIFTHTHEIPKESIRLSLLILLNQQIMLTPATGSVSDGVKFMNRGSFCVKLTRKSESSLEYVHSINSCLRVGGNFYSVKGTFMLREVKGNVDDWTGPLCNIIRSQTGMRYVKASALSGKNGVSIVLSECSP